MNYAIEVNTVAILISIIILVSLKINKEINFKRQRYFYTLIYILIPILIVDSLARIYDGTPSSFGYFMNHLSNFLLYALSGYLVLIWFYYVLDFLEIRHKYNSLIRLLYSIPAHTIFIMSILSIFYDIYYVIDSNNVYTRGSLYYVYSLIYFGYVIAVFAVIISQRKKRPLEDIIPLLLVAVLPIIGGAIQFFIYGISLLFPMSAVSFLILFIFIQLRLIRYDSLTMLSNKYDFNSRVRIFEKKLLNKMRLGCLLIDIDNFKSINDKYGHHIGDLVLTNIGTILKKTFTDYNNIVARIGGDEFGVLMYVNDKNCLNLKIEELNQYISEVNNSKLFDFDINITIGSGIYTDLHMESLEQYLIALDLQMVSKKHR
jgi:diguanylate cyclase (GGDEF)-like protein